MFTHSLKTSNLKNRERSIAYLAYPFMREDCNQPTVIEWEHSSVALLHCSRALLLCRWCGCCFCCCCCSCSFLFFRSHRTFSISSLLLYFILRLLSKIAFSSQYESHTSSNRSIWHFQCLCLGLFSPLSRSFSPFHILASFFYSLVLFCHSITSLLPLLTIFLILFLSMYRSLFLCFHREVI